MEVAVTSFKKATAINSNLARAYNNLSLAYYNKGEYKLAIEYCDKAREQVLLILGC